MLIYEMCHEFQFCFYFYYYNIKMHELVKIISRQTNTIQSLCLQKYTLDYFYKKKGITKE
jgi:hypothetical protein